METQVRLTGQDSCSNSNVGLQPEPSLLKKVQTFQTISDVLSFRFEGTGQPTYHDRVHFNTTRPAGDIGRLLEIFTGPHYMLVLVASSYLLAFR